MFMASGDGGFEQAGVHLDIGEANENLRVGGIEPRRKTNESLLIYVGRGLIQAGRATEALALVDRLQAAWPDRGLPTASWLRIQQLLAEAQLAAGDAAEAKASAAGLLAMLEQENAIAGRAWRDAASLFVLAAARSGDRADAARRLAELASTPASFASSAELADAKLHRAQALAELGRRPEATAVARAVLPLLEQQQVDSPRRTALERLLAPA